MHHKTDLHLSVTLSNNTLQLSTWQIKLCFPVSHKPGFYRMLLVCFRKHEEPCGHLELSCILGPERDSKSLLGRFLGCLKMISYFLSEKQNGVYNLTAK